MKIFGKNAAKNIGSADEIKNSADINAADSNINRTDGSPYTEDENSNMTSENEVILCDNSTPGTDNINTADSGEASAFTAAADTACSEDKTSSSGSKAANAESKAANAESKAASIEDNAVNEGNYPYEQVIQVVDSMPEAGKIVFTQEMLDSAVTVYAPYQPSGPSATQLKKAAKNANHALKYQRRADRRRLREWKKDARKKAKEYLYETRKSDSLERRKAAKRRFKEEKRAWKESIRTLDRSEKKLQQKAYKAFQRRLSRTRRTVSLLLIAALLTVMCLVAVPAVQNTVSIMSLSYSDRGNAADTIHTEALNTAEAVSDEGIVLLKNENNLLPLENKRINLIGEDAYNINYGGDCADAVGIYDALSAAGFSLNSRLQALYSSSDSESGSAELTEELLEDSVEFSNQAIVVIGGDVDAERRGLVKRVAAAFEHVVLIISSPDTPALGSLTELDSIESILWLGIPGEQGCVSLAKIFAGTLNPSGRLPDIWAYSTSSAPSTVSTAVKSGSGSSSVSYKEGIYVGYRYYETRYADDEASYSKNVLYPFGYGLSLTTFEWETVSFKVISGTVRWRVKVTNTGKTPGKDVLQLYYTPPYEEGGSEKSAVNLAAYTKTKLIEPGESSVVMLSFDVSDMASFDVNKRAYVLDAGTYEISLRRNSHDMVEKKEYTAEETTAGDTKEPFLDFAVGNAGTLSRSDWTGTYPVAAGQEKISKTIKKAVKEYNKLPDSDAADAAVPETGANNGIKLPELKGLDYSDGKWELFLDQFTTEELISFYTGTGFSTDAINRLGIPEIKMLGSTSGLELPFSKIKNIDFVVYPSETMLAATFNDELAEAFGRSVGLEAGDCGVQVWYAPCITLHRLPDDDDNYKSFSEDPLLSGKMAAAVISGAAENRLICAPTGFLFGENSQYTDYTWVDEQTLRELYLKPYEIAVKEGGALGIMTSSSNIGYKWCGASDELLKNILRDEWGFNGFVVSDRVVAKNMKSASALFSGTELMSETGLFNIFNGEGSVRRVCSAAPAAAEEALRTCAHDWYYAIVNNSNIY